MGTGPHQVLAATLSVCTLMVSIIRPGCSRLLEFEKKIVLVI
jgi:hypothetical protein